MGSGFFLQPKGIEMYKIPDGLVNLLLSVTAWNHWKEPEIKTEDTVLSATMKNGIVVVFQPEDELFLVQGITLGGSKTRILRVEKDDYEKMEMILRTCHKA